MTRVAVVQPALRLGEVDGNLERIEDLIRDAQREHSPEVILVPEACTTPNVFAKVLLGTPLPVDGRPFQLLTRLSRELGCVIGGGFVAIRGANTYGTYVLAEPDGAAHLHDKDIPTAWEQNYYVGGDDPGVSECRTLGCTVGLMSGWEWARFRTSARVRAAGVRAVFGGMCWPSMPLNWPGPLHLWAEREHAIWRAQARALPGQVARLTGVPVAHASHVGPIEGETPLGPGIPWRTEMIGESQVCDRDGTILARLALEDGEGHIAADVDLAAAPQPLEEIEERFWIPRFTLTTHVAWHAMNAEGAASYRLRHARGGFPWQAWPVADLPDEIPPSSPADAAAASNA
ncbi:MAG TPA: carbon-nitrogen hydrolase family protein [Solirubrobacteraceae bacterium]|nr:carbon-nitrogen hydrolase family protein [Solirubrobacteraceae bacterium]